MVAGAADKVVQARTLAAKHKHAVAGKVEAVVIGFAALIQSDDPEILALEFFKRAHQVHNASNAKMLCRTRACFNGDRTERRRPALGEHYSVHSRAVGNPQQRAKVLRVFNAIESQNQASLCGRITGACGRLEEVFNGEELLRAHKSDYALMRGRFGHRGQLLAAFLANAHPGIAALSHKPLQPRIMTLIGHQHMVKAAAAGSQGLLNRMQAIQNFHEG